LRLVLGDLFLTLGPGLTAPIYLFFFNQAKGFSIGDATFLLIFYGAAGVVWAPMWARVSRSLGKHRTVQVACVLYAIFQTSLMALPKMLPGYHLIPDGLPTAVLMFLVGGCNSAFFFLVRAMLADYADQFEQGANRVALLFSFVGVTQKLGSSFNVAISFAILGWVGFKPDEHAHNTAHAIFGLEMTYLFAPIVFVILGGAFFLGYKLDAKRHAEIRAALDARDAAIERESVADALSGEIPLPAPVAE